MGKKLERPETRREKVETGMTRLVKILRDAKGIYLSRFLTKFTLNLENTICHLGHFNGPCAPMHYFDLP